MAGQGAREALHAVLECGSCGELTEKILFCKKFMSRESFHSSFKEALIALSSPQQKKLWKVLGNSFNKHMHSYLNPETCDKNATVAESSDRPNCNNGGADMACSTAKPVATKACSDNDAQVGPNTDLYNNEGHQFDGEVTSTAVDQSHECTSADSETFLLVTMRLMLTYLQTLPSAKGDEGNQKVAATVPISFIKILLVVGGVLEVLQGEMCSSAAHLCEEWVLRDMPHSSVFASQLFVVLVRMSIEKKAQKSDVKRVYRLRTLLPACLDEQEQQASSREGRLASAEDLVVALGACVVSPVYLSCDLGVKFVGYVMALRSCAAACHRRVKEHLPRCSKTQANRLGQAYCRAWMAADPAHRKELEETCLQDLMYAHITVHPVQSAQLSCNLMAFLQPLHTHQKLPAFSSVLHRLYCPFLWRSLTCANGLMRSNATNALCSAYPLEDLSRPLEERDLHLTRCHTALTEALTDDCPSVRVVAVQGVCRIMHSYWLTLPKAVIQSWFGLLLTRLAYDASSVQVRQQVIKGVLRVVECPDALPFLQQCLPQLGPCFDDCNTAVRLVVVRLLLKLQKLRLIKYWSVVPVSHLLHRLCVDTTAVARLITQLVAPVFLPIQKDNEDLLERTISLLMENRAASRVFFEHVSSGLDVASVVRVMLVLYQALRRHLLLRHQRLNASDSKQPVQKRARCASASDKENTDDSLNNMADGTQTSRRGNASRNGRRYRSSNSGRSKPALSKASSSSDNKIDVSNRGKNVLHSGAGGSLAAVNNLTGTQTSGRIEDSSRDSSEQVDGSSSSVGDDGPQCSPFDDLWIVGGVLDALVILWTYNAAKISLPHNAKWLAVLQKKIGRGLPLLCSSYRGEAELSRTILHLASFLPRSLVPTLVGHCISRVKALDVAGSSGPPSNCESSPYSTYVSALCNWNRLDDLLDLVQDWLSVAFDSMSPHHQDAVRLNNTTNDHSDTSAVGSAKVSKKAGKSRGVRFASPGPEERRPEPKPMGAVAVLRAILHHRLNRNALLLNNRHLLFKLLPTLTRVQKCIELRLEGQASTLLCSDELLVSCWQDALCVTALMHHKPSPLQQPTGNARKTRRRRGTDAEVSEASEEAVDEFDGTSRFLEYVAWTARCVLPSVAETPTADESNIEPEVSSATETSKHENSPTTTQAKRSRKRKLSPQENLIECSKNQSSYSNQGDAASLATSLVSSLLRMAASVVATKTATPALVCEVSKLGVDVLAKDGGGTEMVSACLALATSCHQFLRPYGPQYAEYARQVPQQSVEESSKGATLLPQFSVPHPDVCLMEACIAAALRRLSADQMGTLARELANSLCALDSFSLDRVLRFAVDACVASLRRDGIKTTEEVSHSCTEAVFNTITSRGPLARVTATVLKGVCDSPAQAADSAVLLLLIDHLESHPGKLTEREISAARSLIEQARANKPSHTPDAPSAVLQQLQRVDALCESSSNISGECIEDDLPQATKTSCDGKDTAEGHNKENVSDSSSS